MCHSLCADHSMPYTPARQSFFNSISHLWKAVRDKTMSLFCLQQNPSSEHIIHSPQAEKIRKAGGLVKFKGSIVKMSATTQSVPIATSSNRVFKHSDLITQMITLIILCKLRHKLNYGRSRKGIKKGRWPKLSFKHYSEWRNVKDKEQFQWEVSEAAE